MQSSRKFFAKVARESSSRHFTLGIKFSDLPTCSFNLKNPRRNSRWMILRARLQCRGTKPANLPPRYFFYPRQLRSIPSSVVTVAFVKSNLWRNLLRQSGISIVPSLPSQKNFTSALPSLTIITITDLPLPINQLIVLGAIEPIGSKIEQSYPCSYTNIVVLVASV